VVGKPEDGWDIDTAGVKSVLIKTGNVADDIEAQAKSYGSHLESAATSAGTLTMGGERPEGGPVGAALAEFAQRTRDDITYVAARAGKSIQGTVDATTAYVEGDLGMAADAQRETLKAPDPRPGGTEHRNGPK
jgi:hypothetical protein